MPEKRKIPETAIGRLSMYRRALSRMASSGCKYVSSADLSAATGFTAAQIRKDLTHFGQFGVPGMGYEVCRLESAISKILGAGLPWRLALVGVGNLGSALLTYRPFKEEGFSIVAVFDNDLVKVGKRWEGVQIEDASRIEEVCRERGVDIGIVTVPADAAQSVVSALVDGGVRAILNFAPRRVEVPEGVRLRNVDLAVELEALCFHLVRERSAGRG